METFLILQPVNFLTPLVFLSLFNLFILVFLWSFILGLLLIYFNFPIYVSCLNGQWFTRCPTGMVSLSTISLFIIHSLNIY